METNNNPQLPNSLEAASAAIADRCARDPEWMAKFKANPRQVLEDTVGRKLPSDLQIHLHQNDNDNWHVPVAGAGGKLRDDDLQEVAGGEIIVVLGVGIVGGGIGAATAVGVAGAAIGAHYGEKKKKKKK